MSLPTRPFSYEPPAWAKDALRNHPEHGRLRLANLPTPLYQLQPRTPDLDDADPAAEFFRRLEVLGAALFVKRDDASGGAELGGNKVRKLEFLLAEAAARGCDAVLTIGGAQSNHCRATVAAARMVGLEPHLILRVSAGTAPAVASNNQTHESDIGFVGNLLIHRMIGASIYTCTSGEYGRLGSTQLLDRVAEHLGHQGKRTYKIPVGGSNGLGTWGYIQAVQELLEQWGAMETKAPLHHVVFACGSGGTACGIALGIALAARATGAFGTLPHVHAIGVCDDPDYFYCFVSRIAEEMGFVAPDGMSAEEFVRQHMTVHQGKGKGYAVSTHDELEFTASFAQRTGIVLDPVYSGKALYKFMQELEHHPELYQNSNILFWHTGGTLGLYDKVEDLKSTLLASSPCTKLDIYGKNVGLDTIGII